MNGGTVPHVLINHFKIYNMKNQICEGKVLDYTVADTAVKSGDIVIVEDMAGVAVTDGEVDETIAVNVEGVYSLPKNGAAIPQGKKVYYNATDKNIVAAATGNTFIGYAWNAATAGDKTINVKLSF